MTIRSFIQPLLKFIKRGKPPSPSKEDRFGPLRRLTPVSRDFGFDRGTPVDRYYIEQFLARNAMDVRGHVLEVGDDAYTRRFGGDRVAQLDVLHVSHDNPSATIVGDLSHGDHLPSDTFDCIILTQTLHLIFNIDTAARTLYRMLNSGGVLLLTVPGISQISRDEWRERWYWSFTPLSLRETFSSVFHPFHLDVESRGNVLAAITFLMGMPMEELRKEELDYYDPQYPIVVTMKAVKGPPA